jgi:type IX secretion system substrate protein
MLKRYKLYLGLAFCFLMFGATKLNGQCVVTSTCGYTVSVSVKALAIIPSTTTSCTSGYNYNVQFSYSIVVSGVNTCSNGTIQVQPQIFCNSGQNNGYYTINIPAPTKGNPTSTTTYTGTLTTSTNPWASLTNCATVTPTSLGCSSMQITTDGPGISTTTLPCGTVLPIQLLSFVGYCDNGKLMFDWSTATETNNKFFTIERSVDGVSWTALQTIEGAGNSAFTLKYSYTDPEPYDGLAYYRLRQTDYDGQSVSFDVIEVENCTTNNTGLSVFPNPTTGKCNIQYNGNIANFNSMEIYNMLGEKVYGTNTFISAIDLSNLQNGIYFIRFNLNSKTITQKLQLLGR